MENDKSGFILINKPIGKTSHDVVDEMRKISGIKKIGHSGTLDPFASGVLILAIGRQATRQISQFVKLDKEYIATLRLGAETDTFDTEGKITQEAGCEGITETAVKEAVVGFIGEQKQVPPMFSAKKQAGKKLYTLARQGIAVEREPVIITIHELDIISFQKDVLKLRVACSSGTYIRALARDIGRRLGCGAYLTALCRTAVGQYAVADAHDLAKVGKDNWRNLIFNHEL